MSASFFSYTINVQVIPPVALRGQHVLILLEDNQHNYVFGKKKIYPEGICRMVGGGVEPKELPIHAAVRELLEELKLFVEPTELKELATVTFHITDAKQQTAIFTTTIYYLPLKDRGIVPQSDLDAIVRVTTTGAPSVLKAYELLSAEIDPNVQFAWADYSKIYGPIHQLAFEEARKMTRPQ